MQLILMLVINFFVLFWGLTLNSLVVLCWFKSSHLRKKVCYFTIFLLFFADLLTVATNCPVLITELILWISENELTFKMLIISRYFDVFLSFSIFTLMLVSFERYLAIFHPIFHHTKVTKTFLIKLHFVLLFLSTILFVFQVTKRTIAMAILFCLMFIFPFTYINTKLHVISKKYRRRNVASHSQLSKKGKSFVKSVSTCLLLVACVSICFMPTVISTIFCALEKTPYVILAIHGRKHFGVLTAQLTV